MMVISNVSAPASGANFLAIVASGSTWLIDMVSELTKISTRTIVSKSCGIIAVPSSNNVMPSFELQSGLMFKSPTTARSISVEVGRSVTRHLVGAPHRAPTCLGRHVDKGSV
uniref:Uncharacterized protein n=1 Tax=Oryza rufipogon TaxID=4529 RepID=A0A0E0QRL4_ORYRU